MECAPDCRNAVTDGSGLQNKHYAYTALHLPRFTLFKGDFSCLFCCRKPLFVFRGMFLLMSCSFSLNGLLVLLRLNKKAFFEGTLGKLTPCSASFCSSLSTSLMRAFCLCAIICLPAVHTDNKNFR